MEAPLFDVTQDRPPLLFFTVTKDVHEAKHPPGAKKGGRKEGRKEGRIRPGNQPKGHTEDNVLPPSARYWSCLPRGFSIRRANFRENVSRMPAAPHNCRFKGYNSKERRDTREGASWTRELWGAKRKRGTRWIPGDFRGLRGRDIREGNGRITNALGLLTKWKLSVIFFALQPSILFQLATLRIGGGFLVWRRDLGLDTCLMWASWVCDGCLRTFSLKEKFCGDCVGWTNSD